MEILKIKNHNDQTIIELLNKLNVSKDKINYLLTNNLIKTKSKMLNSNDIIKANTDIYIDITHFENIDYLPSEYDLDILYEDEYLIIINKPKNTIIYPDDEKGLNTLANYVRYYYLMNNINRSIRHVHRLDKDTTGCILYAKDVITHSALSKMMQNKEIKRIYQAKVIGKFNSNSGIIDFPIGKNRHVNGKMVITKNGKKALTNYQVIDYDAKNNVSTVLLELKTGRTHQIRVHLAAINHPLIGDELYNPNNNGSFQLISKRIVFIHPITCELIDICVKD